MVFQQCSGNKFGHAPINLVNIHPVKDNKNEKELQHQNSSVSKSKQQITNESTARTRVLLLRLDCSSFKPN